MTERAFDPRVAIVTGAGRGIGRATARLLALRSIAVALASRSRVELLALEKEIRDAGGHVLAIQTDVTKAAQVERLVGETETKLGPVDVLVNNAGVVERAPIAETTEESWDRVLDINLKGAFLCTRAVLPRMMARRRGRILNVSSISGTLGTPSLASYCASKWGLIGFTKAAAEEARPANVQVMAVCPGSVETDMLRAGLPGAEPQMSPETVASLLFYLATDAPAALTATSIDMFG